MNEAKPDVAKLSSAQVRTVLSLGLASSAANDPLFGLRILRDALESRNRQKLKVLLSDLRSPIPSPSRGPLALERLTGAGDEVVSELKGKTFLDALTSPGTSSTALSCLLNYGELLTQPGFSEATQLTGTVIRLLALSSLSAYHKQATTESIDLQSLTEAIQAISKALPKELRDYAIRTTEKRRPV